MECASSESVRMNTSAAAVLSQGVHEPADLRVDGSGVAYVIAFENN